MANKKTVTEVIKVGAVLFAITAVAAAVLASVNKVTDPVILKNNKEAEEAAMIAVLPKESELTPVEVSGLTADGEKRNRAAVQTG